MATADATPTALGAIVLTGGRGARMGGVDKAGLPLEGEPFLRRVLAALAEASPIVVVGPPPAVERRDLIVTREDPPGGGPGAGLVAGLLALAALPRPPALVVVAAVDMPLLSPATVRRLRDAVDTHDGAWLTDATGRRQLVGVLRLDRALTRVPPADERSGVPVHRLLGGLDLVDVPAEDDEARDVDTWHDLADVERIATGSSHGPEVEMPSRDWRQ